MLPLEVVRKTVRNYLLIRSVNLDPPCCGPGALCVPGPLLFYRAFFTMGAGQRSGVGDAAIAGAARCDRGGSYPETTYI